MFNSFKNFTRFSHLVRNLSVSAVKGNNMSSLIGIWNGTVEYGAAKIPLIFRFTNTDSEMKGYVDVPTQSAKNIPIENIVIQDDSASFSINRIGASFSGKFLQSTILEGVYEQNNIKINLSLNKVNDLMNFVLKRPQTPKRPFDYIEENILIENKEANITLSGTLTYPKSTQPIALVILAHGSGGHDRDETIFEHKPFMVIADHLTKHNIAVLRYDERGIAKSSGKFDEATDIDITQDLLCAIRFAKQHPRLPKDIKLGIIGHSKGGLTSLLAKTMSDDIKFIVFLASTSLTGEETIQLQSKTLLKAANESETKIEQIQKINSKIYEIVKTESDIETVKQKVIEFTNNIDKIGDAFDHEEIKTSIKNQLPALIKPWFKRFLIFDPRIILSKTTIPILALWGSRDMQVPAKINLNEMKKALEAANNTNFELKILEGLNHLFQNCKTGLVSEYGEIEETFSVEALNIISDWIKKQ